MLKEALAFYGAIEGKVRETVKSMSGRNLQCERYDVTTAPDSATEKIGVTQPYGQEIFVPYSAACADAQVGDTVLVVWWKSLSNAKAWFMGDKIGEGGGEAREIAIQDTEPTDGESVWIDTDNGSFLSIPQVDDESVSSVDTWSSLKISQEISNSEAYEEYEMSNSYGTLTFRLFTSGIVVATLYAAEAPAARTDLFAAGDYPDRFRPGASVYISGVNNSNEPRSMSFLASGIVRAYAGGVKGAYVTVTYISASYPPTYVLPPYYAAQVENVETAVNALSDDWVSFAVVTDTHTYRNQNSSQDIIRHLMDHSTVERCFWLGDVTRDPGWVEDQYKSYRKALLPVEDKIVFALGNHERPGSGQSMDFSLIEIIYDEFVAPKNYQTGDPARYYYYFDDTEKKIRYVVINTTEVGTTANNPGYTMTAAQLSWIDTALTLPDSSWSVAVFGHVDINTAVTYFGKYTSSDGDAIKAKLAATNGHLIGYFCGHEHCDNMSDLVVSGNTIGKQVVFICDEIDPADAYAADGQLYPTRTPGTNTDQAVTVVSINLATKTVELRRIGAATPGMTTSYSYS